MTTDARVTLFNVLGSLFAVGFLILGLVSICAPHARLDGSGGLFGGQIFFGDGEPAGATSFLSLQIAAACFVAAHCFDSHANRSEWAFKLAATAFVFFLWLLTAVVSHESTHPMYKVEWVSDLLAAGGLFTWGCAEEAERRRAAAIFEAQRKDDAAAQAARAKNAEEEAVWARLKSHRESSQNELRLIDAAICEADQAMDDADDEFADGAFAPFWDAVERAGVQIANANNGINAIIRHSKEFHLILKRLEGSPPAFDIRVDNLNKLADRIGRLESVVRRAQKAPHFATIFELRRINRSIIQGFGTLGEALQALPRQFYAGVEDLRSALEDICEEQGIQTEILDNIQRRRKPRE